MGCSTGLGYGDLPGATAGQWSQHLAAPPSLGSPAPVPSSSLGSSQAFPSISCVFTLIFPHETWGTWPQLRNAFQMEDVPSLPDKALRASQHTGSQTPQSIAATFQLTCESQVLVNSRLSALRIFSFPFSLRSVTFICIVLLNYMLCFIYLVLFLKNGT